MPQNIVRNIMKNVPKRYLKTVLETNLCSYVSKHFWPSMFLTSEIYIKEYSAEINSSSGRRSNQDRGDRWWNQCFFPVPPARISLPHRTLLTSQILLNLNHQKRDAKSESVKRDTKSENIIWKVEFAFFALKTLGESEVESESGKRHCGADASQKDYL